MIIFLRLDVEQTNVVDDDRASPGNTVEAQVTLDSPFYVRSVINGSQYLLRGTVKAIGDKFSIENGPMTPELGTKSASLHNT